MLTRRSGLALLAAAAAMTSSTASAGPFSLFGSKEDKKPSAARSGAATQRPAPPQHAGISRNQRVAEEIAAQLKAARLSGYNIHIEFKDGVASLNGSVSDDEQCARASRVVSRVPGVIKVQNHLRVERAAAHGAAPEEKMPRLPALGLLPKSDSAPAIPPKNATAATGPTSRGAPAAAPPQTHLAAPPTSAGAPPTVPARSNQQVADDIARSLKSARLNGYDIEIHFQDGVAQLNGTVSDPQQIVQASHVVSQVAGVQQVDNRLRPQSRGAPHGGPQAAIPHPVPVPVPMAQRPILPVAYQPGMGNAGLPSAGPAMGPMPPAAMPPYMGMNGAAIPPPPGYGHPGQGQSHTVYNMPQLPDYAWPTYAAYPNSAQISYPTEYSASAWPYIGPFYPYPQVPLGWRKAQLEWDDGYWNLTFNPRTDKWFWFMNPKYW